MTSPFGNTLEKMLEVFREQEGDIPPDLQRQLEMGLEGLWTTYDEWNTSRAQELLGKRLTNLLATYPALFRIDADTVSEWERRAGLGVIASPRHITNAITMVDTPEPIAEVQHNPGIPAQPEPVRMADLARAPQGGRIPQGIATWAAGAITETPPPPTRMAVPVLVDDFQAAAEALRNQDAAGRRAQTLRWFTDDATRFQG